MIIDCHVHIARELTGFWEPLRYGQALDRGQVRQVFPPAFDPTANPPEIALHYMDQVGVDKAILVQHHLYGDQNATVIYALNRWPDRFIGFAYLGAIDQVDASDRLERLFEAGLTGLKVELESTRRLRADFSFDGAVEWSVWERLNALHRPLILDINAANVEDVPAIRRMLDAFPHLRISICHLGGAPAEGWEERALLAKHPRVWLDLASLQHPYGEAHEYPYPYEQELIRWAVRQVGAHKLMWGTDWPGCMNWATYRQLLDVVRKHCAFLTPTERQDILAGSAERFIQG